MVFAAPIGTAFTYQGKLADGGNPANGGYSLMFTLYDDATGTSTVAGPLTNSPVAVTNGLFTTTLDFGADVFAGDARWLEIAVRSNGVPVDFMVLSPRQPLTPAPYALYAPNAGAAASASSAESVAAANITGIVALSRLPAAVVTNGASDVSFSGTVTAERVIANAGEPPTNVTPVLGMVWIKPGTFIMGSRADEPGRDSDEGPQTVVTLTRGFWMGVHEVTQAEYQSVMASNPSFHTGDSNRPVETVTWQNATNYCGLRTQAERTAGRIPGAWAYRLPTEAEWEYCCRAGARTTRYGYGDDLSYAAFGNYAWYSANSGYTTHPVEQKLANPWGLMDMHGNAWEWCQDWYGTYPGGSVIDPQGPGTLTNRVTRGGDFSNTATWSRSAKRGYNHPSNANKYLGFRVVLAPGQP